MVEETSGMPVPAVCVHRERDGTVWGHPSDGTLPCGRQKPAQDREVGEAVRPEFLTVRTTEWDALVSRVYSAERRDVVPAQAIRAAEKRIADLEARLEAASLRSIEARNPGIDMEQVKRERQSGRA